jgi:hypothetical protein
MTMDFTPEVGALVLIVDNEEFMTIGIVDKVRQYLFLRPDAISLMKGYARTAAGDMPLADRRLVDAGHLARDMCDKDSFVVQGQHNICAFLKVVDNGFAHHTLWISKLPAQQPYTLPKVVSHYATQYYIDTSDLLKRDCRNAAVA